MKKIPITAAAVVFVALLAVLVAGIVKNNRIETKSSTAANSEAVSTETVTEETEGAAETEAEAESETEKSGLFENIKEVFSKTTVSDEKTEAVSKFREDNKSETTSAAKKAVTTTAQQASVSTTAASKKSASTTKADATTSASTYEYSYAGFNPTFVTVPTDEKDLELFLVNRDYVISSDYTPTLAYAVTGDTSSKKLDYRVAPHYNEMYQAALKDGITLTTVSGYRSYSLQKTNFERKIQTYISNGESKVKATQDAAKIILPPGTSEHNVGLAMDIISLEQNFENTKAFAWLQANAADYGFILRYPKDKQDVTKIIYEPWHWRYVGVENAKKIKASGKCLEEYLGKA